MGGIQDEIEEDIGAHPRCARCASEYVAKDAYACWNPDAGLWELEMVLDDAYCHVCEGQTHLLWSRPERPPHLRIRDLNDRFRREGQGNGTILVTRGIKDYGDDFVLKVVDGVRSFDAFSQDNDPWGEHDFGAVDIEGQRVFFKIDYYNPDCTAGSENPANEGITHRVLTIMLPSEY